MVQTLLPAFEPCQKRRQNAAEAPNQELAGLQDVEAYLDRREDERR